MTSAKHYDKNYFAWQKKVGSFGAEANKIKFEKYIIKGQKVLDFGCGGGYLLSNFQDIERFGGSLPTDGRVPSPLCSGMGLPRAPN